ncbi:GNAT family N-acyltransferase [Bacteroidota bacterium]
MKLVDHNDLVKAANLGKSGGEGAAKFLMVVSRLNRFNRLYSKISHKGAIEFIDNLFEELEIKFEVSEEELNRIPVSGSFIAISNHPYGGIDGMLLIKMLSEKRSDFKVLANFLLKKIEPLKNNVLNINPFENNQDPNLGMKGLKNAFQHLNEGKALGIFPAGSVSSFTPERIGISDQEWQYSILKFIKKIKTPIIPIYFQGSNSRLYHILGLIHPLLRTVRLPSELFNKKNKVIKIRIGNPISLKEQDNYTDISRYGRYLRAKTYSLGTAIEVKKFFSPSIKRAAKVEQIIDPIPQDIIQSEINELTKKYLLFKNSEYCVFCAPSVEMPNIVNEIGRLREITFREIGEGTNRKIDIDEFDLYFHQLFIWDENGKKIVGAYRIGKGKEIIDQYGKKGFYIQSLFKIHNKFLPILKEAIELGRSFIIKDYQRKPLPLFLLWKGILYFLIKHPEYRYLIGPVSISNRFSTFSKSIIIEFMKANFYNDDFARFIKSRNSFKVQTSAIDKDILMENASNDLNKLDKTIKDIEPDNIPIPVLLKKYLKQNAKIIGFNIDPKFNDALDGLMILDLFDVPIETITSLSKEINDESLLDRFFTHDVNIMNGIKLN